MDVKDTLMKARDNERAVRMLSEVREREGKGHGELARVARQLGVHPEALRSWVK
jgi:transposase-like protein